MSLNLSSCANFRMVATRPAHQSFPENLYVLWAYQAETVLVCHAWSSIISIVQ